MIDPVDLIETRHDRSDLDGLRALVKQLVGQPFRFFRISHGDELRLHLGELRESPNPRMRGRSKGSHVIATRASSWIIYSARKRVLMSDEALDDPALDGAAKGRIELKSIERGDYVAPDSLVTSVRTDRAPGGFALRLGFSDDSTIYISPESPSSEDPPGDDAESSEELEGAITDWEVMTPHQRILKVGPGERWNYADSTKKRQSGGSA